MQVPLLQQSTQLEFAAGLTTKLNARVSFYVQAGYEFAVGGTPTAGSARASRAISGFG